MRAYVSVVRQYSASSLVMEMPRAARWQLFHPVVPKQVAQNGPGRRDVSVAFAVRATWSPRAKAFSKPAKRSPVGPFPERRISYTIQIV